MLERIKHYFDDERIIFIVSVNKEQLVHTISKYYGYGFDSTGYLNRFFDLNTYMPVMPEWSIGLKIFPEYDHTQFWLTSIAEGLNEYYKLSLRDSLIFKQRISDMPLNLVNDSTAQSCCLSLFIPIIAILDIKDENEKTRFLNGNSDIIERISKEIPPIQRMISRFGADNRFEIGLEKFKEVYNYTFKNGSRDVYNKLTLEVTPELKRLCIMLCNKVEI